MPKADLQKLFQVAPGEWGQELDEIRTFLDQFGHHLPYEIRRDYERMSCRLRVTS